MLHHVELYVGDLERSVAFWTPLMQLLGYGADRWSGGMNYLRGETDTYLCQLQAPAFEDPDRIKHEVVATGTPIAHEHTQEADS